MIHRDDKGERRASPEAVAAGGDVAPVGFHPGPNDGQTYPRTPVPAVSGDVHSVEALEQMGKMLGSDPFAAVGDGYHKLALMSAGRNNYTPTLGV